MDLSLLSCDISFDILSRLPVNTLVQMRHVSKGWQRLISDPEFIQLQMSKEVAAPISGFFFQERFEYCENDAENLSYVPAGANLPRFYQNVLNFLPEKVVIWASSNGLVCCRSCNPSPEPFIYICNPVNKHWVTLSWEHKLGSRDFIAFSFEPSMVSEANVVTGCKLIRVSEVNNITETKEELYFTFEKYDWERGGWVKSREICCCEDALYSNKWVMAKGFLYWLTDGGQILVFDVQNDFSLLVSLPMPLNNSDNPATCLGESNGELNMVMVSSEALLVWALVDHLSSKWDLKFYVPLKVMEEENPKFLYKFVERVTERISDIVTWIHPLGLRDGLLFLRVSTDAYSFDVDTRKMQWLCDMSDLGKAIYFGPTVVPYSMSLVMLVKNYGH